MFFKSSSSSSSRSSSSSSRQLQPWSNVEGISVHEFVPQRQAAKRILADDVRFGLVAASVSMALDLLKSRQGYGALIHLARKTLADTGVLYPRTQSPEECAKGFLTRIPGTMPAIIINDLHDINGRTTRADWNRPAGRLFVAQHAGLIEINGRLLHLAVVARNVFDKDRDESASIVLNTLVFRMGITVAHELCHIFTCYLLYNPRAMTPPDVTFGASYTNNRYGEAGRFWESFGFGGFMDMRQDRRDGSARVAVRDAYGRYAYVIRGVAVKKLSDRDFQYLPCISDEGPDRNSVAVMELHTWKTQYRDVFPKFSSPPPKLPEHLCQMFTSIGHQTITQDLVSGSALREWMHRPRSTLATRQMKIMNT